MDTAAGSRQRTAGTRQRAAILGSLTILGIPEHVSVTRAFIARTLAAIPRVDSDAATLLTSELVTNAIQHTDSGTPGGTVTVVVIGVPEGTTVWFHLQAGPPDDACQADTPAGADPVASAGDTAPVGHAGRAVAPDGHLV